VVRECTHILPNGRKCAQFALRGQLYCSPHMDPGRRRKAEALLYLIEGIAQLDLYGILDVTIEITTAQLKKQIPGPHAQAAYVAIVERLEKLNREMGLA
jgi:hypothetical protein